MMFVVRFGKVVQTNPQFSFSAATATKGEEMVARALLHSPRKDDRETNLPPMTLPVK
jgi:hypothetical protein